MASSARPRVLSGIQPSGELHIGNYLGAVRTKARVIAKETMREMRDAMGLGSGAG